MADTDKSLVAPAIFGLAAICFCTGLMLGGDWTSKPYEQSQKPYASAHHYASQPIDVRFAAYPFEESNRCYGAKDYNSAELCAEWRAAIAAEKAANSAKWANRLGLIGAILTIFGLGLVYRTFEETRSATKAANDALHHSRDISEKELRPWIAMRLVVTHFKMSETTIKINYTLQCTNIGKSIATKVEAVATIKHLDERNHVPVIKMINKQMREKEIASDQTLLPGDTDTLDAETASIVGNITWEGVGVQQRTLCLVIASVAYRTPFDEKVHYTQQSFAIGKKGESPLDGRHLFRNMRRATLDDIQVMRFRSGLVT